VKITVTVCRKEGRPNYGSEGATCSIEFEADDALIDHRPEYRQMVDRLYAAAEDSVKRQLGRASEPKGGAPNPGATQQPTAPAGHQPSAPGLTNGKPRNIWGAPPRPQSPPPPRGQYPPPGGPVDRHFAGDRPPRSGKQLFAWARRQEDHYGPGLIQWLTAWGEAHGYGALFRDWPSDAILAAHAEAAEKMAAGAAEGYAP
jgi:hypothetical protein